MTAVLGKRVRSPELFVVVFPEYMTGEPLRALDLFTGIGGVCMGLKGIVHPTLHCEIFEPCKAVLRARMGDGTIPECPVAGDIKELTFARKEQVEKDNVEIILSSWPCTGLSHLGKRLGFQNEKSGLFFEVMRLIDEIRPPAIFLENVPNVLSMVMHDVVKEMSVQRGYDMRWAVVPASAVGAPHIRERWFCLATLPGFQKTWTDLSHERFCWSAENEPPRMVRRGADPHRWLRCGFAGNAVVPDCVRLAFFLLASGFREMDICAPTLTFRAPDLDAPCISATIVKKSVWPRAGFINAGDGRVFQVKLPKFARPNLELVLKGHTETPEVLSDAVSSPLIYGDLRLKAWSTPRFGNAGTCNVLTKRSSKDLPTQLKFERGTPVEQRSWSMNADFVTWLMGIRADHTKVSKS